jgi:antitoxin (DNA-binding transcriptional repressor) of toxin-antitoxin stability system
MKTMNISYFKAHISQELRAVRNGETLIIKDRDIPVADVVPHTEEPVLTVRSPTKKLSFQTLSFNVQKDPLSFLREDRGKR